MRKKKLEIEITVKDLARAGRRPVKLGADKGSGFIYCGDITLMDADAIDAEIQGYHRKQLEINENRVARATAAGRIPKASTVKALNTSREKLENYVPVMKRVITEIYPSVDEKGVLIALFDGTENGASWTTKEYETCRKAVRGGAHGE